MSTIKSKVDLQIANQKLFWTKQKSSEPIKEYSERIANAKHARHEVGDTLIHQMLVLNKQIGKQAFEAKILNQSLKTQNHNKKKSLFLHVLFVFVFYFLWIS